MAVLKCKGSEIGGSVLALVIGSGKEQKIVPMIRLGAVPYESEKGSKSITHIKSANFMGDIVATTEDNHSIVFKGMMYSKASVSKGSASVGEIL